MMWASILVVLVVIPWSSGFNEANIHSEEFIRSINEVQNFWRAGINFQSGSFVKNLISVLPMREERLTRKTVSVRSNIPDSFDGRKAWRRCRSVVAVKEQGNCASAWAIVAAGVFTDRLCVSKVDTVEVSAQNVLSCCKVCGTNCYGGYVSDALEFLSRKGAPSRKCHPYEIYGCPKTAFLNCPQLRALAPRCRVNCRKPFSKKPLQDARLANGAYSLSNSTQAIMSDIMSRGPVAAVIDLFEDLLVYKTGVYSHTRGRLLAHHPVQVIGWGRQGNTPYWLVRNSWGTLWGDKGLVKMARESSGCNLENRVFALDAEQ